MSRYEYNSARSEAAIQNGIATAGVAVSGAVLMTAALVPPLGAFVFVGGGLVALAGAVVNYGLKK